MTELERKVAEWLDANMEALRTNPKPARTVADSKVWGIFCPIILSTLPRLLDGRRDENPVEVIRETVGNAFEIARLVVEIFDKLLADYRAGAV